MAKDTSTTKIRVDVAEFNRNIKKAQQQITLANAEFKKTASSMQNWAKSTEGVGAKLNQLAKLEEAQKIKLEQLEKKYQAVARAQGEDSREAQGLRTQILNQQAAINRTERETERYNQTLQELQEEERQSTTALGKLKKEIKEQEKELQKAKQRYTELVVEQGEESKAATEAATSIDRLSRELQENQTRLNNAEQAADRFDNTLDEVEEGTEEANTGFTTMKATLANLIAEGIQAAISKLKELATECVTIGSNFETAMSEVQAISGATGKELQDLTDTAREYGKTTQYSASESASALKYMALAGWSADQSIDALGGVLNLAAASSMDLGRASDIVTDYLSAFGLTAKDSSTFVDKMAYAMSSSNTDTEQLAEAYKNCAAVATQLGYNLDDTTSSLMVMANGGLKGGEAGTALAAIMTRLGNNVSGCRDMLEKYGVQVYDSNGKVQSLSSILGGLQKVYGDLTDKEKSHLSYVVAGKTAQSELMTVLGDSTGSFEKYAEGLKNCTGKAQEMATTMNDNLQGDLKSCNSAWEDLNITIYNSGKGAMREFIQTVTSELIPSLEGIATGADGAWEEFGKSIGNLATMLVTKIGEMLPEITGAAANIILALANGLIQALPELVATIPGIIIAVVTAITEQIPTIVESAIEAIPKIVEKLLEAIPQLVEASVTLFLAIVEAIPEIIPKIVEAIQDIVIAITTALVENTPLLVESAVKLFMGIAEATPEIIKAIITMVPEIIASIIVQLAELFPELKKYNEELAERWGEHLLEAKDKVVEKFGEIKEKIIEWFSGIVEDARENIGEFVNNIIEGIKGIPDSIAEWFGNAKETIAEWLAGVIESVAEWAAGLGEQATEAGTNFLNSIVQFFKELPYKLGYLLGFALGKVTLWATDLYKFITKEIPKIIAKIVKFFSELPSKINKWLTKVIEKAGTWVINMAKKGQEAGEKLVNKVIEFVKNLPSKIQEKFNKAVEKASNFVNNLGKKGKEAGEKLVNKVIEFVKTLPDKIKEKFDKAIEKAGNFVTDLGKKGIKAGEELIAKIQEGVAELPSKMLEIGGNIVDGVWNGINDAKDAFVKNVKDFFGGIVTGAKDALGIHSPSRVMRDQVGKYIALGIAEGINLNKGKVTQAMQVLAKEAQENGNINLKMHMGIQAAKQSIAYDSSSRRMLQGFNTGTTNNDNKSYTFNQYNNSPKALSRLEIYKQTQRQLKMAKGGI